MKQLTNGLLAVLFAAILLLYSCSKSGMNSGNSQSTTNGSLTPHTYGVLPMQPEQWASIPVFSRDLLTGRLSGVQPATLPASYLLSSPAIRDQGQIGSCTGFCGAETNEILHYYHNGGSVSSTGLSTGTGSGSGLLTATQTENATSSVLSPLFVYYVERCVILKESVSSDNGAYMVDIPETFQGLSNNTGTGKALTLTINRKSYNFAGVCTESLYAYPSNGSDRSTQYRTAPSATAISNAVADTIGKQSGTTGSSGTTSHGYFVINSSDPVSDAKAAIASNLPVMMGFNVYDNSKYQYFEGLGVAGYAPNNFTYNPLNSNGSLVSGLQLLGGHAVPLIGYIDDATQPGGGVFICQNSWSTSWGFKGYFYLPYSVLRSQTIVSAGSLYVAII